MGADPRAIQDGDIAWLRSQVPETDFLGFGKTKVNAIFDMITASKPEDLPRTIGIFGTWGTGKSTLLAMLTEKLIKTVRNESYYPVVYFNAWKYAGFMEIVPALIYKVLRFVAPEDDPLVREKISKVMLSLGKRYSDQFGRWAGERFGINFIELAKDVSVIHEDWTGEKKRQSLLDEYYTQVDKAQDALREIIKDRKNPVVVLIDELDRCDPGEAFDVIKKLRVFFSMREIPIVFVLSVNPEPIGAAIRHQFGLGSDVSDYETRRIMEKFVDTYIEMSEPIALGSLIKHCWKSAPDSLSTSLVHTLDKNFRGTNYSQDTVRNADVFMAMETDNYLYSNLRILKKSLEYVLHKNGGNEIHIWSKWHLEILRLSHFQVRKKVAKVAEDLKTISIRSHLSMLKTLHDSGHLDLKSSGIVRPEELHTGKGNTAFSIFRSFFWELSRNRIDEIGPNNSVEVLARQSVLQEFQSDRFLMEFVIVMSVVGFRSLKNLGSLTSGISDANERSFGELAEMGHFAWMVANV